MGGRCPRRAGQSGDAGGRSSRDHLGRHRRRHFPRGAEIMSVEIQYERPPTGALPLSVLVEMTTWPLTAIRAGFEAMIADSLLRGYLQDVEIRTDGIWQEVGT